MIELKRKEIDLGASVSCFDLYNFEKDYTKIEKSCVSFLHYDVVDGYFNNCLILGSTLLETIRLHIKLPIEVHLAVNEPERFIDQFAGAGADYISVHWEAMKKPLEIFRLIEKRGAVPVLALKSTTQPDKSMLEMAKDVPWILVLTVNPGFSGQQIQPAAIGHIKQLRTLLDHTGLKTGIQADGNINIQTIPDVVSAGADMLTGGTSGLFLREETVARNAENMLKTAYAVRCT